MTNLDAAFEAKVAEKQNAPALMEQVNPETGEVTTTNLTVAPLKIENDFDFDALESASVGVNLIPAYWSPNKEGQTSRGYFQGYHIITKNEPSGLKEIKVATWLTREGVLMNGGAGFVKLFDNVPVGTPVQLTYSGQAKTAAGHKVNEFKLNLLNI